ncbi:phage tail protein [Erwinia aphidicola]|uniref:phage tail protein n=1 Tax=Erwinia aphidicola TaxID=68334 RepID=UPI0030CCAE5F
MATDTFEWPVRISGSEQITVSAVMAQFGDGYRQVAENGINSASEAWNLSVNGQRDEMAAVRTFLKNHVIRSFWWINPWGEKTLQGENGLDKPKVY